MADVQQIERAVRQDDRLAGGSHLVGDCAEARQRQQLALEGATITGWRRNNLVSLALSLADRRDRNRKVDFVHRATPLQPRSRIPGAARPEQPDRTRCTAAASPHPDCHGIDPHSRGRRGRDRAIPPMSLRNSPEIPETGERCCRPILPMTGIA